MSGHLKRNWLPWLEAGCLGLGVALLATYVGFGLWSEYRRDLAIDAFAAARDFANPLSEAHAEAVPQRGELSVTYPDQVLWAPGRIREYRSAVAVNKGAPEAILRVAAIGLEVPVFPGASEANMTRGAGRIEGTPGFGGGGNVALSSHRDGYFRVLKDIRLGHEIDVETLNGRLRYRVVDIQITEPRDVGVLRTFSGDELTLVTCYPFYFVGSAPDRFVVRAERMR